MFDENRYPTMRFLRCKKCGNIFVESLSGSKECPDCSSENTDIYEPDDSKKKKGEN